MPDNAKTTWKCAGCNKANASVPATTTCTSSTATTACASSTVLSSETTTSVDNVCAFSNEVDVTFVHETKGKINKKSPLAILQESDYQITLNLLGWLNCDIIHMAQVLLHEIKPSIEGFQRPTLGPARNFDVVSAEFIQRLHTGNNHWVCISPIGCVPGYVNLYDSPFHYIRDLKQTLEAAGWRSTRSKISRPVVISIITSSVARVHSQWRRRESWFGRLERRSLYFPIFST